MKPEAVKKAKQRTDDPLLNEVMERIEPVFRVAAQQVYDAAWAAGYEAGRKDVAKKS